MLSRAGCDRECGQSGRKGNGHRQRHQQWRRRRRAEQETARIRGGEGGQPGTWPGLRDARPKRDRKIGVGGDRAPSNLVFVKLRGRKIEGAERVSTKSAQDPSYSYRSSHNPNPVTHTRVTRPHDSYRVIV